jgi:hypothetical protein
MAVAALFIGAALGLAALIYPAVALSGDADTRRARERERATRAEAAGQEAAAALARYMEQLRAELDLPVGLVDDAVQEIADHIEDTRRALIEEGLESGAAVREALARLGRPNELARNITAADRSTRRVLAGAAGGIFSIPGGFVLGGLTGLLAYVPAVVVLSVAITNLHVVSPLARAAAAPVPGMILLAIGFFAAARTGVRACAALSYRKPSSIGWIWALLGTSLIEAGMILGYRTRQSWPLVVVEVLVPLAFAAGAMLSINSSHFRLFRTDGQSPLLASIVCLGVVLGLVAGLSTTLLPDRDHVIPRNLDYRTLINLDVAGPLVDKGALPGSQQVDALGGLPLNVMREGGLPLHCRQPQNDVFECDLRGSAWAMNEKTMAGIDADTAWRDVRLEVWQGIADSDYGDQYASGGIVQGVSAPTIVVPLAKAHLNIYYASLVTGSVHVPPRRDGPSWWIVVTAEGPDGYRYRLTNGTGVQNTFDGSVWEWLTAEG